MNAVTHFDRQAIDSLVRAWDRAFEDGEYQAIAGVYDDHATLVSGKRPPLVGLPSITGFWREACARAARRGIRRTVHIDQYDYCSDAAYLQGTIGVRSDAGTTVVWFVTVWRRHGDHTWRIVADVSRVAARARAAGAVAGWEPQAIGAA